MIKLIHGDCLEKMRDIPDNSVDLILTDPPYDFCATGGGFIKHRSYKLEVAPISNSFDFGVLGECIRVLKKLNIYIYCNKKLLFDLLRFFDSPQFNKDILVWHKTNPTPACGNNYLPDLEYVFFAREKGVKILGDYKSKSKLYQSKCLKAEKKEFGHPTIKPMPQLLNFIMNSTKKGDTVLDLFMGSGSTGVACVNTGRKFIGIERDAEYFKIAEARINSAHTSRTRFSKEKAQ